MTRKTLVSKTIPYESEPIIEVPEQALCLAMLERSILDCLDKRPNIRNAAIKWIFTNLNIKYRKAFCFNFVCDAIGADPEKVREIVEYSIANNVTYSHSTIKAKYKYLR